MAGILGANRSVIYARRFFFRPMAYERAEGTKGKANSFFPMGQGLCAGIGPRCGWAVFLVVGGIVYFAVRQGCCAGQLGSIGGVGCCWHGWVVAALFHFVSMFVILTLKFGRFLPLQLD